MGQEQLQQMLEKLGSVGVLAPALALGAGVLLWLLGRKLARPACTFSGLVLGGIGGVVLGEALVDSGGIMLALVVGAAIAGALLAALLFRVWMAISGAVIFGLAAGGAVLLWQGPPGDSLDASGAVDVQADDAADSGADSGFKIDVPIDALTDQVRESVSAAIQGDSETQPSSTIAVNKEAAAKVGSAILDALRGVAEYYRGSLSEWWTQASAGSRGGAILVGLVAAAIGLLIGLIGPYFAASVQSAAAGSVLMLFSSFSLLAQLMPEHLGWLPASPREVLVCLGLITVIGLFLQWMFFAGKADK